MNTKSLLVPILALAACKGGDPKPADSAPPPPAAAPAPVAPPAPPSEKLVNPDLKELTAKAPAKFNVVFVTSKGEVEFEIERQLAPIGVDRFYYLANNGFFNGSRFFRVVRGFVAQFGLSGIPAVDAAFEPLSMKDDPRKISNTKGTLVFAAGGSPDTRVTQMFINLADNGPMLDQQGFAPLGKVVRGMENVDQFFSSYGEMISAQQGLIMSRGNTWLHSRYPELDSIVSTSIKK